MTNRGFASRKHALREREVRMLFKGVRGSLDFKIESGL